MPEIDGIDAAKSILQIYKSRNMQIPKIYGITAFDDD